jgi:hypothetical protein
LILIVLFILLISFAFSLQKREEGDNGSKDVVSSAEAKVAAEIRLLMGGGASDDLESDDVMADQDQQMVISLPFRVIAISW